MQADSYGREELDDCRTAVMTDIKQIEAESGKPIVWRVDASSTEAIGKEMPFAVITGTCVDAAIHRYPSDDSIAVLHTMSGPGAVSMILMVIMPCSTMVDLNASFAQVQVGGSGFLWGLQFEHCIVRWCSLLNMSTCAMSSRGTCSG